MQVFRALEYPAEMAKQEYHRDRLITERWKLIRIVSEHSGNTTGNFKVQDILSASLSIYEKVSLFQLELQLQKNIAEITS